MPHRARIVDVSKTSDARRPTQRILLQTDGFHFDAGQYLAVIHPNGTEIPLSIASSPSRLPRIELHYRSTPDNVEAAAMDELLTGQELSISDAHGNVACPSPSESLVVIAGGTGAALAFCLANHRREQAAADSSTTEVIWCADTQEDIYDTERLRNSADAVRVFVDAKRTPDNEGLRWLHDHAAAYGDASIAITGSPPFVYAVTDVLLARGIDQSQLQSDVYQYAPRE